MSKDEAVKEVIRLIKTAQEISLTIGIRNIVQPGIVKELILSDILGHELISTKRGADGCDPNDPTILYEYLSCDEGGYCQFDRMFKSPPEKRAESLYRISRNKKIYMAFFSKVIPLTPKAIYEVEPDIVLQEAERALDASSNDISHFGFNEKWARLNGKLIYPPQENN